MRATPFDCFDSAGLAPMTSATNQAVLHDRETSSHEMLHVQIQCTTNFLGGFMRALRRWPCVSESSTTLTRRTRLFSVARTVMADMLNGTRRRLASPLTSSSAPPSKRAKTGKAHTTRFEGTHEDALLADIVALQLTQVDPPTLQIAQPERFTEHTVTIHALSGTGDGLGTSLTCPGIIIVPFTVSGDVVIAKITRNIAGPPNHTHADFVSIIHPSPERDDTLVRCRYFGRCGGCQLQMLPYAFQLSHKRDVVRRAFSRFSGLPASVIPAVGETKGSPLQYGYRTKLTPHFDGPRNARKAAKGREPPIWEGVPAIGYAQKGRRATLDIEECPIGTAAVQMGLRRERTRVARDLKKYSKGATLLLRESTERLEKPFEGGEVRAEGLDEERQVVYEDRGQVTLAKTCVTDHRRGVATEYVDDYVFRNSANAFFQNNNSILPSFTDYIRRHVLAPPGAPAVASSPQTQQSPIRYLIDAYSGSGLFTITLSSLFERSIGIDIDPASIAAARVNARLNDLASSPTSATAPPTDPTSRQPPTLVNSSSEASSPYTSSDPPDPARKGLSPADSSCDRVSFIAADAGALFASVSSFPAAETAVILDPPRKGCDIGFLSQLLAYGPERIVYVSCNVHTQARDVGWLLRGGVEVADGGLTEGGKADAAGVDARVIEAVQRSEYEMESLVGFDFFPQTAHVEGVAVLRRKRQSSEGPSTATR